MGLHVQLTLSAKMSGGVSRAAHDRAARFASRSLGLALRTSRQSSLSTPDNSRRGSSQSPRRASALQLHPCIRCVLHTNAGARQSAIERGPRRIPTGCQYGFGTRFLHRVHSFMRKTRGCLTRVSALAVLPVSRRGSDGATTLRNFYQAPQHFSAPSQYAV